MFNCQLFLAGDYHYCFSPEISTEKINNSIKTFPGNFTLTLDHVIFSDRQALHKLITENHQYAEYILSNKFIGYDYIVSSAFFSLHFTYLSGNFGRQFDYYNDMIAFIQQNVKEQEELSNRDDVATFALLKSVNKQTGNWFYNPHDLTVYSFDAEEILSFPDEHQAFLCFERLCKS